jgi:hypothetical protein
MDILSTVLTSKDIIILIADAFISGTFQTKIAEIGMSSLFSVEHFIKDQETLDHAIKALDDYMIIGIFGALILSSLFYLKNNMEGFIVCLISNIIVIVWLYYSYKLAFDKVIKKYNLKYPTF